MIIALHPHHPPALEAADDFTSFTVTMLDSGPALPKTLAEIGALDADQTHVWVNPAWLQAHGPQDAGWRHGLEKMLAFAAGKGWVDGAGHVRAHIAFTPAGG